MFIALVAVTALLAVIAVASAAMKLRRAEPVVTSIHRTVGVPMRFLPVLAGLEVAGAVGILVGLWLEPLGVAAAAALVLYFVGAVIGHLRVRDTRGAGSPLLPLVLAVAVLVLRLTTA